MPPKEQRRKVIKTMSRAEIQNEFDEINSLMPHLEQAERVKLRVRLSNLEKALMGGEGGEGGAGEGGFPAAGKRKLPNRTNDPDAKKKQKPETQVVDLMSSDDDDDVEFFVPSSSSSHAAVEKLAPFEAGEYAYESTSVDRGAGESDLEYLQRLVRGEAQLERVIQRLRTDHAAAAERAAASTARFAEEDRVKQAEFDAIESEEVPPEGLQAQQDRSFKNVSEHYRLRQAHKHEMETLATIQRETERVMNECEPELESLSSMIRNLKVKPRVALAIKDMYPGKTPAEAFDAFVREHSAFGRRKVRKSLLSFFGNYTALHPNVDARTVVQKYARALMYV